MATVLFKGVFDQILLKTAKNDTLRLSSPHFKDNWTF